MLVNIYRELSVESSTINITLNYVLYLMIRELLRLVDCFLVSGGIVRGL